MARVRALVVALLTCGLLTGLAGAAFAEVGTTRAASFCGTARSIGDDFAQLDPSDFDDEDALADLRDAAKRLAREAPRSLKRSFRTVIAYYDKLVDDGLDLSDEEAIEELATRGTRVSRAVGKIIDHLVEKCDVSLE